MTGQYRVQIACVVCAHDMDVLIAVIGPPKGISIVS